MEDLTWNAAQRLVGRGVELGRERDLSMTIAVLDGGRELKAFGRCRRRHARDDPVRDRQGLHGLLDEPDDGHAGREDVVGRRSARARDRPLARPWSRSAAARRCAAAGQLVGAVGVSGGTPVQDHELAVELAQLYEAGDL